MKKVLFVCIENSCRSQMAEAFARIHGEGVLEPYSAGSRPSGVVNPKAIRAMEDLGYDMSSHQSIGLDAIPEGPYDYVITMGCGDACPWVPAHNRADWDLQDPKHMEPEQFNEVRDDIGNRMKALIAEVQAAEAV